MQCRGSFSVCILRRNRVDIVAFPSPIQSTTSARSYTGGAAAGNAFRFPFFFRHFRPDALGEFQLRSILYCLYFLISEKFFKNSVILKLYILPSSRQALTECWKIFIFKVSFHFRRITQRHIVPNRSANDKFIQISSLRNGLQ